MKLASAEVENFKSLRTTVNSCDNLRAAALEWHSFNIYSNELGTVYQKNSVHVQKN